MSSLPFPLVQAYFNSGKKAHLTHLNNGGGEPACSRNPFRQSKVERWGSLEGYPTCELCQRILKRREREVAS